MFIVGIALFAVWVTFAAMLCANYDFGAVFTVLFNSPSWVSFVIVFAAVIIATGGSKTLVAAVNALISKRYVIPVEQKEKAVSLFKLLGKTSIYNGIMMTVLSLGMMLQDMSDPAMLGPSVALALATVFYATLINIIIINPAIHILESRYNAEERRVVSEKQIIDKLLELCHRQGISPEEIIEAKEIHFRQQ